jgi:hypothetical protein
MEKFKWNGCLITGYPFTKNAHVTTFKKIGQAKKSYKKHKDVNKIQKYRKAKQNETV